MNLDYGGLRRVYNALFGRRTSNSWYKEESTIDLPNDKREELRKRGFLASTGLIYNFERYGYDAYVNTRDYRPLHPINGPFSKLIDDKGFIPILLRNDSEWLPEISVVAAGHRFYYVQGVPSSAITIAAAIDFGIDTCEKLFAKPCFGGGGKDVYIISRSNRDAFLEDLARNPQRHVLIQTQLRPEDYSREIFPNALNTFRIIFFKNKRNEMRILRVLHRFGTSESAPVDNSAQGGMVSRVRIESGALTESFVYRGKGNPGLHYVHPETKAQIEGFIIPQWPQKLRQIQSLLDKLSFLDYGGLDIAPTSSGLKLLEVNSRPALVVPQIDGPLLADAEFSEFLREKGYQST